MREIKAVQPVMPEKQAYMAEISDIWSTGAMTNNGPKVQKLRKMLTNYTGIENVELFVNGHAALYIALKALNLTGEVITSPFTFVSTTNAIIQAGLTPVFGDVDDSYNLSPESIEKLISEKTSAIVTPHIFGIPCDVERLEKIAKQYNLKIIYDGAQAFGTKIKGKSIGSFGDATMFSLHAIKVYNSVEGGILTFCDPDLKDTLELYRNFGISYGTAGNDVMLCGINAKLDEFRASMGIVNLPGLDIEIKKRRRLAERYIENIKHIPGVSTYNYKEDVNYNYAYFPVKITENYALNRDELFIALAKCGIGTRKLYDKLTCDYYAYCNSGYKKYVPYAERLTKIALDLPLYGNLTIDDIDYITGRIEELNKR